MNIRIVFYSLFRSSVQKSVRCPFFYIFFKLFATGNPDRNGDDTKGLNCPQDFKKVSLNQVLSGVIRCY